MEKVVTPAESITSDMQFMRGHGTYLDREREIVASVAGEVVKVNKLISVIPVKQRYTAEVGDVVVGRIVDVGPKRWKVDLNGKQEGILLLSSVNLPGGVQRRRLESDELQMRSFFSEGDLMVAEVQQIHHDEAVSLHTRSLKYGKLREGILIDVPTTLVKRSKVHFISLPFGVDLILGVNGKLFIRPHLPDLTMEQVEADSELLYSNKTKSVSSAERSILGRLYNCIRILTGHFIQINEISVTIAYESSMAYDIKQLIDAETAASVAELVRAQLIEE